MRESKKASVLSAIQGDTLGVMLLDCAPAGIVAVNGEGAVIAFNPTAEKLTGWRAEDVLGKDSGALPPGLQAVIDEVLVTGEPVVRRQIALNINNGTALTVSATLARQQDGSVLSVTAELQDLAANRAVAANLEHLDRLAGVGVVTAGVAHEIKNALVAVRTFFDLLSAGENDAELRSVAGSEVHRMERIVRQLLRGARREEFHMAGLSMHALLQDALNLVRHEIQGRSIQIETALNAPGDRVNGDERQLRHALVNILMNAAEAMTPGGRLGIFTNAAELEGIPAIRISISDTGHGIAPENVARLFSPFFTTKPDGTGLGLAISRRIVQAHRGLINVDTKVGDGTTFQLTLPLA